jgi:hypothetical protein
MDQIITQTAPFVPNTGRDSLRNSILDVQVSCFTNYNSPENPRTISLLTWIFSGKYREEIQLIRETGDKSKRDKLKSRLPAITPSGIFTYRNEKSLVEHNGLIQFDIDLKDNMELLYPSDKLIGFSLDKCLGIAKC